MSHPIPDISAAPQAPAASFYRASALLRSTRLALGAVQRLWPGLGVRLACRLFGTPLPPKWRQRRASPAAGWRHEAWAFERAGLGLYRPAAPEPGEGPVALLIHGWGGHAGQLLPLAGALAAQGWRPRLLELPAHGRSAGWRSNLPQFARAIEYAVARLAADGEAPVLVAAHSAGANALAYAAARGLPAERLVLLAPPASPREFTQQFAGAFGLSEGTRAAMQRLIESREAILMPQFEPQAVGPRIDRPTLVVHDRDDKVNRFADGEAYRDAIAGARLVATTGHGHRRMLTVPQVLAEVVAFASQPLAGRAG